MNILDYGSGRRERVLDFWREDYGIAALKKYVKAEVGNLRIHAFDPLAIVTPERTEQGGNTFQFHATFATIPDAFDIICALHPYPLVILHEDGNNKRIFEYNRYIPFLAEIIGEKSSNGGKIILQFDDCLDERFMGTGVNNS